MANSWMRARLSDHLVRYRHSHRSPAKARRSVRRANHFTGRPKLVSWRNARGQLRHGQCPLGSKADIATDQPNVRFTPKSGHWLSASGCPLCATSGLMQCSKFALGQKRGHFITPRQCPLFPRKRTSSRPRRGKVSNLLRAYLQAIKRVQSGTKGADSKPKLALLCVPNA